MRLWGTFIASALVAATLGSTSAAAPPWVDRRIVMSGAPLAASADVAVAFGRYDYGAGVNSGGALNLDAAIGLFSRVDVGVGVGVRPGETSALAFSDAYARFFNESMLYTAARGAPSRASTLANPELRVRGKLLDVGAFELGLETRVAMPVVSDSRFTTMLGVPMAAHVGHVFRLDFGIYNVFAAYSPFVYGIEVPVNFWIGNDRIFYGLLTGVRYASVHGSPSTTDIIFGGALGFPLTKFIDVKLQLSCPRIEKGAQFLGAGAGLGLVFE